MPAKKTSRKVAATKASAKKVTKTSPLSLTDNKYLVMILMVCSLIPLAMIMQVFFSNFRTISRTMPEVFVGEESTPNRVFVTSTTYNGNLGELAGADTKCQERASAANLSGIWKAWLSDDNITTASRLVHSNQPYIRIDGALIASNWTDLTDGTLQNAINIDEFGQKRDSWGIWSNTQIDGTRMNYGSASCNNWNSAVSGTYGHLGTNGYGSYPRTDSYWTWNSSDYCSSTYPLYCFEQIDNPPTPSPTPSPVVCPKGMVYPHYKNVKGVCSRFDECGRSTCNPSVTPKPRPSSKPTPIRPN